MTEHYHHCPECYDKHECDMDCTIEPDLEDDIYHPGKQFGAHCLCPICERKIENKTEKLNQEWFDRYNGYKR